MIKAYGDYIILIPEKLEETTEGGIFLPDTIRRNTPPIGKVFSVEEYIMDKFGLEPSPLVNKRVIYNAKEAMSLTLDSVEYIFIKDEHIIAVLNET